MTQFSHILAIPGQMSGRVFSFTLISGALSPTCLSPGPALLYVLPGLGTVPGLQSAACGERCGQLSRELHPVRGGACYAQSMYIHVVPRQ